MVLRAVMTALKLLIDVRAVMVMKLESLQSFDSCMSGVTVVYLT